MKTTTTEKNGKTTGKKVETKKTATQPKAEKKQADEEPKNKEQAKQRLNDILVPNVNARINRLETFQIKVEKFKAVSEKYDDLTHFMAGNDNTNASMKFASASNYSFTLRNPVLIDKILGFVETEFSQIVEKAEKEVLEFNI